MHKVNVVIGSQYGDEGKGLAVDWLASQDSTATVVRHNGGAQAAHTVVVPDGREHVFHHFDSGTFCGNPTHLSAFMICNPIMFNREYDALVALGETPRVTVSPNAVVTLPYDMMINQALEEARGDERHGSCGLGIGETIERNSFGPPLTVNDLANLDFGQFVDWFDYRSVNRNLSLPYLHNAGIEKAFMLDVEKMLKRITIQHDYELSGNLIFEGAQGLLLDQTFGHFPHVTRSNTGLRNVGSILARLGIRDATVHYVTRSYQTRHGAGPMMREADLGEHFDIVDPTNVPNEWQGTLRHGFLDIDEFIDTTNLDLFDHPDLNLTVRNIMTCVDQIKDQLAYYRDDELVIGSYRDILDDMSVEYISQGRTRNTLTAK